VVEASEDSSVIDPASSATHSRLDRAGRALVVAGAIVLGPIAVLLVSAAAWFVSYFSDGSAERGLAAITDVWPVWLLALAVIALVVVALARAIRGGGLALAWASIGGLAIGAIGFALLVTGQHDGVRWVLLLVGTVGGLALASGSVARLAAARRRRITTKSG
jgi:hypothetical protein